MMQPRYLQKKSRNTYKAISLILFIIIIILYGVYALVFLSPLLKIDDISIEGLDSDSNLQMRRNLMPYLEGQNILTTNTQSVEAILSTHYTAYKLNAISKTYPSFLRINIERRDENYLIQAVNGLHRVDSDFVPFERVSEDSVGAGIVYDKPLSLGEKIEDAYLIAAIKYASLDYTVFVSSDQITINLPEGGEVILPDEIDDVDSIAELLKKLIQKYNIENKTVTKIDLRYSKPVIEYKE